MSFKNDNVIIIAYIYWRMLVKEYCLLTLPSLLALFSFRWLTWSDGLDSQPFGPPKKNMLSMQLSCTTQCSLGPNFPLLKIFVSLQNKFHICDHICDLSMFKRLKYISPFKVQKYKTYLCNFPLPNSDGFQPRCLSSICVLA